MKTELCYNKGMLINDKYEKMGITTLGEVLLLECRKSDEDAIVMSNNGVNTILKLGDLKMCFVIGKRLSFILSKDKITIGGKFCQALTFFPIG